MHHRVNQSPKSTTAMFSVAYVMLCGRRKRRELWSTGNWRLHHDNAPAHSRTWLTFLAKNNTPVVRLAPYFPPLWLHDLHISSSRFNHPDHIRWTEQTMKFLIVQPSPLYYITIYFKSKCLIKVNQLWMCCTIICDRIQLNYISQGSHTGQLDFCNWLAYGSTTG